MNIMIILFGVLSILTGGVKLYSSLVEHAISYNLVPLYVFYIVLGYGYIKHKKWVWYATPAQILLAVLTSETSFSFIDIFIKKHVLFDAASLSIEFMKGFLLFHPTVKGIFGIILKPIAKAAMIFVLVGAGAAFAWFLWISFQYNLFRY